MNRRVFAIAVLSGAFLLFLVQPLIGRFILPWFGGGQMVWTGCLLFFQTALLGGYAWSFFADRVLGRVWGARVHLVLLAACLPFLPLIPSEGLRPDDPSQPLLQIVLVLMASVGMPYFVLSTTGPLLQSWFAHLFPGRSPYRLFAVSNLGSLIGLFAYPFAVEPFLTRQQQAWAWSGGFVLFAFACGWCAVAASRGGSSRDEAAGAKPGLPPLDEPDDGLDQLLAGSTRESTSVSSATGDERLGLRPILWLLLSCVPSILLVATTSQISQEIAVVPFLWILPLGLYLLSFVFCFDHPRWYLREFWTPALVVALAAGEAVLWIGLRMSIPFQIAILSASLFAICMSCHGELARWRPGTKHLTLYYLCLALGGAAGGLFVGLVAPNVFPEFWELPIGFAVAPLVVGIALGADRSWWGHRPVRFALPILLPLWCLTIWTQMCGASYELVVRLEAKEGWTAFRKILPRLGMVRADGVIYQRRDAYGLLKVREMTRTIDGVSTVVGRKLINGRIEHGFQLDDPERLLVPSSYYGETSGLGTAIRALRIEALRDSSLAGTGLRIGVVGLGTGAISAWGREGDEIVFYELSPHVDQVCRDYFDFLEATPASTEVRLGDARVTLEREVERGDEAGYDVLVIDAFSSDAIPMHLLTREAFEIYERRLRPGGVIAVHISNRFLDLAPIVRNLSEDLGATPIRVSDGGDGEYLITSEWVLVTRNQALLADELVRTADAGWAPGPRNEVRWTDDFGSLWQVLRPIEPTKK